MACGKNHEAVACGKKFERGHEGHLCADCRNEGTAECFAHCFFNYHCEFKGREQ